VTSCGSLFQCDGIYSSVTAFIPAWRHLFQCDGISSAVDSYSTLFRYPTACQRFRKPPTIQSHCEPALFYTLIIFLRFVTGKESCIQNCTSHYTESGPVSWAEHFSSVLLNVDQFEVTFHFLSRYTILSKSIHVDLCFIDEGKVHPCTGTEALYRLCTGCTACRGSRGIALLFHDHGNRSGRGFSVTPRPLFTPGKDPVAIVQEAGWAPGPVWTGAENLAPPGFDPRTVQPVASRYTDYATRPKCFIDTAPKLACHSTPYFGFPDVQICCRWFKGFRGIRCQEKETDFSPLHLHHVYLSKFLLRQTVYDSSIMIFYRLTYKKYTHLISNFWYLGLIFIFPICYKYTRKLEKLSPISTSNDITIDFNIASVVSIWHGNSLHQKVVCRRHFTSEVHREMSHKY
jgi:hypothetical protein